MFHNEYNLIVLLGPTASGKTRLGVRLAATWDGEILSADSRQVYRGLDIGSGKDLAEYTLDDHTVPHHLIDIVDIDTEFSVFDFQQAAYTAFEAILDRGKQPFLVGGTGLYLDAVLQRYRMVAAPENAALRNEVATWTVEALAARLIQVKGALHNTTDLMDHDGVARERLVRALEIAEYSREHPPEPAPDIHALVLGVLWDREVLRERIRIRLKERLQTGLIEEVEGLHARGIPWERLEQLGLEYRFLAEFLQGKIRSRNDLLQKLHSAICQFAKRQDTWFRRMERQGTVIHWIPEGDFKTANHVIETGHLP